MHFRYLRNFPVQAARPRGMDGTVVQELHDDLMARYPRLLEGIVTPN